MEPLPEEADEDDDDDEEEDDDFEGEEAAMEEEEMEVDDPWDRKHIAVTLSPEMVQNFSAPEAIHEDGGRGKRSDSIKRTQQQR